MWFRLALIIVIFVFNAHDSGASVADAFKNSYALVIGIDKYPSPSWDNLQYAVGDARAMENFLLGQDFKVKTLYNEQATRESIVSYLENELAQIVGRNDRFIFFFAGHGHTEFFSGSNERGYLVPYDGKDRSSTYLSMARVRDISDILGVTRHQLFIMDSCYGGRLGSRGNRDSLDPRMPDYLKEVVKRKARQILTAGGATQRVRDIGPEGHSVFAGELLKALNDGLGDTNGDGYISFYELSTYVQRAASRANQTPGVDFLDGHGQGEFIFHNPVWAGRVRSNADASEGTTTGPMRGRPVHEIVKEAKTKFIKGDNAGARPLFREASELGNAEAMFFLGLILFKNDDDKEGGLRLVRQAANRGHVPAMQSLLEYYSDLNHFNATKAERWKKEIAQAEMLRASARLIDPTGGGASKGDPEVPEPDLRLSGPTNLQIISQ